MESIFVFWNVFVSRKTKLRKHYLPKHQIKTKKK